MKVAIIMGRGIEGCGVTKFTVEQTKWLAKNSHEFIVYASKDKSWTRKNAHDVSNVVQFKFAKADEMGKMIADCNTADMVIINSLPSVSHPKECIEQFIRFLNEVKRPVVLIQHDHSSLSIKRNAAIEESVQRADVLFGHSTTNDFARYVEEKTGGGGLAGFLDDDSGKTILPFQPGIDFNDVRAMLWRDIDQTDPMMNKWIGRTTSWKGYKQMFAFHNQYLRPNGYITTLEGIEKSPAYLAFKELSEFHGHIGDDITSVTLAKDEPAYVFGPYVNTEMLKRMSKCGFGYQLSVLDQRFIQRSIEYTHCELACAGVVPVFLKAYGDRCTHRYFGKRLTECDNSGTIWLDDDNMGPAFELLDQLAKDKAMRDEYRVMAFEFYKLHQDSQYTFSKMMEDIETSL